MPGHMHEGIENHAGGDERKGAHGEGNVGLEVTMHGFCMGKGNLAFHVGSLVM